MKARSVIPKQKYIFRDEYGYGAHVGCLIFGWEADVRWVNVFAYRDAKGRLDLGPNGKIIGDE